jgi:hypothetical protein
MGAALCDWKEKKFFSGGKTPAKAKCSVLKGNQALMSTELFLSLLVTSIPQGVFSG